MIASAARMALIWNLSMKIRFSFIFLLVASISVVAQPTDSDVDSEKHPLGYIQTLVPIEGSKTAKVQFGEVKPLPYQLTIKLKPSKGDEKTILSGGYAFYSSGYIPITPGEYELVIGRGEDQVEKKTIRISKDNFYTLIVKDFNGKPNAEILEDVSWEIDAEGNQVKSKKPRLRIYDLINSNSTITAPSLNLKSKVQQSPETITVTKTGSHQFEISGVLDQKPFTRYFEIDFSQTPQSTIFLMKDLYDRAIPKISADAVLE